MCDLKQTIDFVLQCRNKLFKALTFACNLSTHNFFFRRAGYFWWNVVVWDGSPFL